MKHSNILLDMLAERAIPAPDKSRSRRQRMVDGVELQVDEFGPNDGQPLLFCHGFGQTRIAWRETVVALAERGYHCIAYDMRGHGDSDWLPGGRYAIDQFRSDLLEIVAGLGTAPVLVGASMGGLIGLTAEGENDGPALFKAMVLVDVTPRWEVAGVERIIDFMRSNPEGFANLDEAAAAIASYLPHRINGKSPDRLRQLLVRRPDGRLRWHWDPALLDVVGGDIARYQPRLIAATKSVTTPLLLVSGGASDVVSNTTIDEFLTLAPHARHVCVPTATHMVVGDDNSAFTTEVRAFIADID